MSRERKARLIKINFKPFQVPANGRPLTRVHLPAGEELIVFRRRGISRALLARQMAYHHMAQGELAGEPYLVSF